MKVPTNFRSRVLRGVIAPEGLPPGDKGSDGFMEPSSGTNERWRRSVTRSSSASLTRERHR